MCRSKPVTARKMLTRHKKAGLFHRREGRPSHLDEAAMIAIGRRLNLKVPKILPGLKCMLPFEYGVIVDKGELYLL